MTAAGMIHQSACIHPIYLLYGRVESCAGWRPACAALCDECAPGIVDRPDGAVPCLGVPLMHPLQIQSTLQHTPNPIIAHPQHAVSMELLPGCSQCSAGHPLQLSQTGTQTGCEMSPRQGAARPAEDCTGEMLANTGIPSLAWSTAGEWSVRTPDISRWLSAGPHTWLTS